MAKHTPTWVNSFEMGVFMAFNMATSEENSGFKNSQNSG
jgi:hypothetical protein